MTTRFLGLEFQPLRLEDGPELKELLRRFPQRISGYTFASLAAWAGPYGFEWARMSGDCVLVSRPYGEAGERHLLQPIGPMSGACCETLLSEARALAYPLKLLSVARDFLDGHPELSAHFDAREDRAGANYVYLARDLAELPGRRYARKRNLVAQFEALHPGWDAVPMDGACGPHCVDVLLAMARGLGVDETDPSVRTELEALDFTMRSWARLGQQGLLLRVGGQPVAFSVYERLNPQIAAVHFEKADRAFKGSYQVINREAARRIQAAGCTLVNREEDLGDAGLRQSKLSYYPLEIYPVYDLTLRA